MHLHQIGIQLTGNDGTMRGREVTPAGLHGVFYDVIKRSDPEAATWLHAHDAPKPYTLAPSHYDEQQRDLAGMLLTVLSKDSAEIVLHALHNTYQQQTTLHIGKQACHISDIIPIDNTSFAQLSHADPTHSVSLNFLTPTSFKQRHGALLFPLPRNVFWRPFSVWQQYAPPAYQLPADWLDWCKYSVFVTRHEIRSVRKNINRNKSFSGFVGKARFNVQVPRDADEQQTRLYSSILHALAQFSTFAGIGRKTTMGMGSVEMIH